VTSWVLLRAAGIGAYLMLFSSVAWGLVATTSPFGRRIPKPSATLVHQFMSTCGLSLVGVHVGLLLTDQFMPFTLPDVLLPMRSSYRPVGVAFGVVAMYALVGVIVLSWLRRSIGTTWWRRSHLLAVPTFTLTLVHGIFAGTDSVRPWMWIVYLATGALVLFLVVVRGLTAGFRPPRPAPSPHHAEGGIRPRATRTSAPARAAAEPAASA
jgi:sulfoxide reductase heme-binding subunit YedZ